MALEGRKSEIHGTARQSTLPQCSILVKMPSPLDQGYAEVKTFIFHLSFLFRFGKLTECKVLGLRFIPPLYSRWFPNKSPQTINRKGNRVSNRVPKVSKIISFYIKATDDSSHKLWRHSFRIPSNLRETPLRDLNPHKKHT